MESLRPEVPASRVAPVTRCLQEEGRVRSNIMPVTKRPLENVARLEAALAGIVLCGRVVKSDSDSGEFDRSMPNSQMAVGTR